MQSRRQILIVDDEEIVRESLAAWLRDGGYIVKTAASGPQAVELAKAANFAICFVDLKMPGGMDGIATMSEIRRLRPDTSIVMLTAYATVDSAVRAMKAGAQEYLVKPCNPEEISLLVDRLLNIRSLERENKILRRRLTRRYRFQDIITKNARMQEILQLTRDIASLRSTVLIRGESGTGKELIARAIHYSGDRAGKPFVSVSCAALSEAVLESEIFGVQEVGSNGVAPAKKGKFEAAAGGTLFLHEIADISPKLQADLLHVLHARSFYRVGGTQEVKLDARVIAATKKDLAEEVRQGRFRDDLYYRLSAIKIDLPPLRERREDVPLLARHFIERLSHETAKPIESISEPALRLLMNYDWPGNVRELENAIERGIVTCRTTILEAEDFRFLEEATLARSAACQIPPNLSLQQLEKEAITVTLQRTHGNMKEAASILGIDRSTLYEKVRRYEIPR